MWEGPENEIEQKPTLAQPHQLNSTSKHDLVLVLANILIALVDECIASYQLKQQYLGQTNSKII